MALVRFLVCFSLVVVCFASVMPSSQADEVRIPFAVYVEDFKKDAKEQGLDLYDNRNSDGFIQNKGQEFYVFTYKPISMEHLDLIKELTWKHIRD
jgi:hypothetical protein